MAEERHIRMTLALGRRVGRFLLFFYMMGRFRDEARWSLDAAFNSIIYIRYSRMTPGYESLFYLNKAASLVLVTEQNIMLSP
jgi:hypothetical protein